MIHGIIAAGEVIMAGMIRGIILIGMATDGATPIMVAIGVEDIGLTIEAISPDKILRPEYVLILLEIEVETIRVQRVEYSLHAEATAL